MVFSKVRGGKKAEPEARVEAESELDDEEEVNDILASEP